MVLDYAEGYRHGYYDGRAISGAHNYRVELADYLRGYRQGLEDRLAKLPAAFSRQALVL